MEPPILQSLAERLEPAHTALVIIDMQKDFCVDGFATSKAGRPLAGALVCHVGFWTLPDYGSDSGPWLAQRRRATYATDKIAIAGTEGAEFIDQLAPADGELVVHKHRYSAFKGTDLDMMLRAHGIETVVPTGVSTNVCVESTLRDAFEYNYYVCVPEDGVASWNMDLHAATLTTVDARFGLLTTWAEVMDIWGARAGRSEKPAAE